MEEKNKVLEVSNCIWNAKLSLPGNLSFLSPFHLGSREAQHHRVVELIPLTNRAVAARCASHTAPLRAATSKQHPSRRNPRSSLVRRLEGHDVTCANSYLAKVCCYVPRAGIQRSTSESRSLAERCCRQRSAGPGQASQAIEYEISSSPSYASRVAATNRYSCHYIA